MKRAAVCIGVNRAGKMTQLQAAVKGAKDFENWAKSQNCSTKLLVDEKNLTVTLNDIFQAVGDFVDAGTYDALIIYFSGHGILTAPGTEYWLLSHSPQNPNEAVNLLRSVEDARNSGIPHVVFVSDACRSSVKGPPLSGVTGGVIFPNQNSIGPRSEVDVYYATRPGDPAFEVPEKEATRGYRGIFTEQLLKAVESPKSDLVESVIDGARSVKVITSRKLKPHLESAVPLDASAVDIQLRQIPELRVESALPKFFAIVANGTIVSGSPTISPRGRLGSRSINAALNALRARHFRETRPSIPQDTRFAEESGLANEVRRLVETHGREKFETRTGFSIFGAKPLNALSLSWRSDPPFLENNNTEAWHIRLQPKGEGAEMKPSTVLLAFDSGTGTPLAVLPGFIGTVVVNAGRITSVSYIPSAQTWRFNDYKSRAKQLEEMRAFAAVAARHGHFMVEGENATQLAARIRQGKGIDPTLGIFAAYAYAQVGQYVNAYDVFKYMQEDSIELPVPFDVVMLATRYDQNKAKVEKERFAPFCPMLSQGWALLMKGDALFKPIHQQLRQHLLPSLWTTLNQKGIEVAQNAILKGDVK